MRIIAKTLIAATFLTGCQEVRQPDKASGSQSGTTKNHAIETNAPSDEVAAERAKLSPEDRALVDAQEWCVETKERLGSMGAPIKLDIKGQAVFVCCGGCKKKAESDPDKTLATLAEFKAKKAAEKSPGH